jgi:hypothetical protein
MNEWMDGDKLGLYSLGAAVKIDGYRRGGSLGRKPSHRSSLFLCSVCDVNEMISWRIDEAWKHDQEVGSHSRGKQIEKEGLESSKLSLSSLEASAEARPIGHRRAGALRRGAPVPPGPADVASQERDVGPTDDWSVGGGAISGAT